MLTDVPYKKFWTFLLAQMVQNLPAMWETQIRSLGWVDPLEKEMATHSSILAWRIPWTEKLGGLQSMGLQSQTQLITAHLSIHLLYASTMCTSSGKN